ncbi:MAG TPA: hypothetical protein VGM91_11265 [Conexibacter sp.]|jgi:hypothetical protein
MTQKSAFNAEEWSVVVNAPALTALLVIAASKGGTVRETVAIGKAYQAVRDERPSELMRAILATPPALDRSRGQMSPEDLRREAPALLRQSIGILERLGTAEEVAEYKRFVYRVADSVARAHKEGGFLGIGGTQVSEHEQAALDEIASIFDEPPSIPPPVAE